MKHCLLVFTLVISLSELHGQSIDKKIIASNGNTVVRPNVSVDWTIGQLVAANATAGTYTVLEGFHADTKGTTGVKKINALADVQIYPVPAEDQLYVRITQEKPSDLSVQVYDMRGAIVKTVKLRKEKTQLAMLDLSGLAASNYIVSVNDGEAILYKATIVKNR